MDFVIRVAIGAALFFLIRPKTGSPSSAKNTGRLWLAWSILLMTFIYYPHQMGVADEVAIRLFGLFFVGTIAFTIGAVVGWNKSRAAPAASADAPIAPAQHSIKHPPAVAMETIFPSSGSYIPESEDAISPKTTIDEDHIYTEIAKELETGMVDKGLWTRLFSECGGDERATKVAYIRRRSERLISDEKSRIEMALRQRASEVERKLRFETSLREHAEYLKSDVAKVRKILYLTGMHVENPKLVIDEKESLLRLAGGSSSWMGGGRYEVEFVGEKILFESEKDFSDWFNAKLVPFLLSLRGDSEER